jgi:hypothetical protein
MRRKFYLHKRGGVFYACLVNRETGLPMSARSTGERDRDAALIVVSGWLRDGLPGAGGQRRKVEAAFDLDAILRGIRKAELDAGAALAIMNALKERGLIGIETSPPGKESVDFISFCKTFLTMTRALMSKAALRTDTASGGFTAVKARSSSGCFGRALLRGGLLRALPALN